MKRSIPVAAVALVMGAGWAVARGPDVSERISAVEKQGAGTGSTTLALEQAASNRAGSSSRYRAGSETAVPAAAKQPAAVPATQPSPQPSSVARPAAP